MRTSDIIIPKIEPNDAPQRSSKIVEAYRKERTRQEATEVELNRSKIMMIDEDGNMRKVPILSEH
ncbi:MULTISPECIES: hypothetical protein [Vibrio]|uniref:hypothetical protein n=1 Tax=Vibrio TaxID=662 RepID=UPI002075E610|nr:MULTISPECIES: hypothetical protein [Vibrio]USD34235.1 hypothetical protein J8Z27_19535 [Vibrio sp. SCSIO 43186]USD47306.1 hypothetical protein J4N38_19940 [Vibrio sp. SCSIO 43145]USD71359.1 hypothetical protein J4N41_19545 [Vibrio sp. SCSIO 43139]USD98268.1 hypothetical protein CTT30_19740 [Vibrio coralliilyticus]